MRPLEQQYRRIGRRELRVQPRVVERVVRVRQNLYRRSPRPIRRIRLRVPNLAQTPRACRTSARKPSPNVCEMRSTRSIPPRASPVCHPPRKVWLSCGVSFSHVAGSCHASNVAGTSHRRQRIAKQHPLLAIIAINDDRMPLAASAVLGRRVRLRPNRSHSARNSFVLSFHTHSPVS